jgi:hypothetical protein
MCLQHIAHCLKHCTILRKNTDLSTLHTRGMEAEPPSLIRAYPLCIPSDKDQVPLVPFPMVNFWDHVDSLIALTFSQELYSLIVQ